MQRALHVSASAHILANWHHGVVHMISCGMVLHADHIYQAESAFFSRLLVDRHVRTEDPWDADLFFVPALT